MYLVRFTLNKADKKKCYIKEYRQSDWSYTFSHLWKILYDLSQVGRFINAYDYYSLDVAKNRQITRS